MAQAPPLTKCLRPWPWLIATCALIQGSQTSAAPSSPGALLTARGIEFGELHWLDETPRGLRSLWQRPRAVALGRRSGEPRDVFQVWGRFGLDGELLELTSLSDLTRTPELDEYALQVRGRRAAWLSGQEDGTLRASLAHFEAPEAPWAALRFDGAALRFDGPGQGVDGPGQRVDDGPLRVDSHAPSDWSWLQRWQARLDAWAEFGSPHRIRRWNLSLNAPSQIVQVELQEHEARVVAGNELLDHWDEEAEGRPGNLTTWLAERLRDTGFGEQGVAWLKAVGFRGRDYARRATSTLLRDAELASPAADLGDVLRTAAAPNAGATNWPPPSLTPRIEPAAPEEGQWLSLDDDAFVGRDAEGRAPFLLTFLRPDPKRAYVHAYVILWDPRRVALEAVGGAQEPRSRQGEHGPGRIPRDARSLRRLVGAFNGGFRTRHGEFGMGAEGTVYLPPKPYAASVVTFDDGSVGLGTWPDRPGLPPGLRAYRQNLTPLIQDGALNPYRRHYWGGTPEGWQHESLTVRTALCLTQEGFLAYVYGDFLSPETLMTVARSLRCDYALHLDMNAGHTGFEFYRAGPRGSLPTPTLDKSWQARGLVPGASEFEYSARRLTRSMPLMNFPRYIHREQRDFFYLSLRPTAGLDPLPAHWRPSGPAGGWHLGPPGPGGAPSAWAHATVRPFPRAPEHSAHVVRLDPQRLRVSTGGSDFVLIDHSSSDPSGEATAPFALVDSPLSQDAGVTLTWSAGRFRLGDLEPESSLVARLVTASPHESPVALAGLDADGRFTYLEIEAPGGASTEELIELATVLDLSEPLLLARRLGWQVQPPAAQRERQGAQTHRAELWPVHGPGARRVFTETPVVEPKVWAYRQLQHIVTEAPPLATD